MVAFLLTTSVCFPICIWEQFRNISTRPWFNHARTMANLHERDRKNTHLLNDQSKPGPEVKGPWTETRLVFQQSAPIVITYLVSSSMYPRQYNRRPPQHNLAAASIGATTIAIFRPGFRSGHGQCVEYAMCTELRRWRSTWGWFACSKNCSSNGRHLHPDW